MSQVELDIAVKIIEDTEQDVTDICRLLPEDCHVHPMIARSYEEYVEQEGGEVQGLMENNKALEKGKDVLVAMKIKESLVVAAIIDWQLNGIERGLQILPELLDKPIARIVLTRHDDRREAAMSRGADLFLVKSQKDAELKAAIRAGIYLGFERHIARYLRDNKAEGAPELPESGLLPAETEEQLKAAAWQYALQCNIKREKWGILRALLLAHHWWREINFNLQEYIDLPWLQKLKILAYYADSSPEEISTILKISPPTLAEIYRRDDEDSLGDPELNEATENLLAILGYILELSDHDPEFMAYYWRSENLFKESLQPPPWDAMGLADYLQETRHYGLKEAAYWIGSH